jgi:replicative superfamily II helicase
VLDEWFDRRRDDRDVVIKQNTGGGSTGGGSTAVGLLIAQSTLNEGIGEAVYLASDMYLVRQVAKRPRSSASPPRTIRRTRRSSPRRPCW